MTQFIEIGYRGGLAPLAQIVRIKPTGTFREPGDTLELIFADGSTAEEGKSWVADQMRRPSQLIPAEAGTQLLYPSHDPGSTEVLVIRTPVIAWALTLLGEVRPVTPAGVDDGMGEPDDGLYLEMPDGKVFSVGQGNEHLWFDDTEDYRKFVERRLAERLTEQAEPAS